MKLNPILVPYEKKCIIRAESEALPTAQSKQVKPVRHRLIEINGTSSPLPEDLITYP